VNEPWPFPPVSGKRLRPKINDPRRDYKHGVEDVILALDNDAAGRAALIRAIDASVHAERSPSAWIMDPDLYDTAKD
jgi:DNA primase